MTNGNPLTRAGTDASCLALVAVTEKHRLAFQQGASCLRQLLGVSIPSGWPVFPEIFAPPVEAEAHSPMQWPFYFFVLPAESALVGSGGFNGVPNPHEEVQIGYEIAPRYRNRGLATAAVLQVVRYAFSQHGAEAVVAYTHATKDASSAVLGRAGLSFAGVHSLPAWGSMARWQLLRADFARRRADRVP